MSFARIFLIVLAGFIGFQIANVHYRWTDHKWRVEIYPEWPLIGIRKDTWTSNREYLRGKRAAELLALPVDEFNSLSHTQLHEIMENPADDSAQSAISELRKDRNAD